MRTSVHWLWGERMPTKHHGTFVLGVQTWEDFNKDFMEELAGQNEEDWVFVGYGKMQRKQEVEWHMTFREYGRCAWAIKGHRCAGCDDWCDCWLCLVWNCPVKVDVLWRSCLEDTTNQWRWMFFWRSRLCLILKFLALTFEITLDSKVMNNQGE